MNSQCGFEGSSILVRIIHNNVMNNDLHVLVLNAIISLRYLPARCPPQIYMTPSTMDAECLDLSTGKCPSIRIRFHCLFAIFACQLVFISANFTGRLCYLYSRDTREDPTCHPQGQVRHHTLEQILHEMMTNKKDIYDSRNAKLRMDTRVGKHRGGGTSPEALNELIDTLSAA